MWYCGIANGKMKGLIDSSSSFTKTWLICPDIFPEIYLEIYYMWKNYILLTRLQRGLVKQTANIDSAWTQASLPVHSSGLGIWRAVYLAPSAFLASTAACSELTQQILPERLSGVQCIFRIMLLISSQSHEALLPKGIESFWQRSWNTPLVQAAYNQLLSAAQSEASQAFFSSWNLERISFGSMQSHMEDKVLRVAMGLRIGTHLV